MIVPVQSLAAMLMDHLSEHAAASPMTGLSTHEHRQESRDGSIEVKGSQNSVPSTMAARNNQTCDDNQSVCNQCDNCSHCINLIDSNSWRLTSVTNYIENLPTGIIPSPDTTPLFRPPIRS